MPMISPLQLEVISHVGGIRNLKTIFENEGFAVFLVEFTFSANHFLS